MLLNIITLKLKNISVYYYLQKTLMSIKNVRRGSIWVCVCTEVSINTGDSSLIPLEMYTHLKIMFTTDHLFIKRFGHHHQFQQWNIIVVLHCHFHWKVLFSFLSLIIAFFLLVVSFFKTVLSVKYAENL